MFYGERFLYPFAIDLLSGVLVRAGVDILFAHLVPAVLLSLMLLVSLYKFYEHFTKSARASFVSILLIIFSGGLGFIWLIENILAFGKTTLLSPTVYYTDMLDKGVYWFNIFVGELIPQRAFVLGMIVFLWVIVYLDKLSVKRFSTQIIPQIFLISLASSSLMLVHTHSLLTLMMVSAVYAFCRRQNVKFWLYCAFFTAVPSSLIYFFFYAGSVGTNYFHFLPGWLSNNSYNFFYFWMINWGIFFPLAIYAFVKGKSYLQPLVLSGAFLFVISNLVVFQPNAWDNTKILAYSYIFLMVPVSRLLNKIFDKFKVVGVLLLLILCLTGIADVWNATLRRDYLLWSYEDIQIAKDFNKILSSGDIVLTYDGVYDWVLTLTKGQILLGYRGWIWTYGFDYSALYLDIEDMYRGTPRAKKLFDTYDVKYVVIGNEELHLVKADEDFFKANYPLVLQSRNYRIYKIK